MNKEQMIQDIPYEVLTMKLQQYGISFVLNSSMPAAALEAYVDDYLGRITAHFKVSLPVRQIASYKWPATWWDAFKARWFPEWLLKRYPAMFQKIKIDEVLANVAIPKNQNYISLYTCDLNKVKFPDEATL